MTRVLKILTPLLALLLALTGAFVLGWMASRMDLRQLKREDQASPQAYFKGLNLLLNEQHDKAIDAFIDARYPPETRVRHARLWREWWHEFASPFRHANMAVRRWIGSFLLPAMTPPDS